jgi:pilus assembly protein Flp/PilA
MILGRIRMNAILEFMQDEEGLTAIEYVIAAALLVAGLTTVFTGYGEALQAKLTDILASF